MIRINQEKSIEPPRCKICDGDTEMFDVVDFNKSCLEQKGALLPRRGIPIYYHMCRNCEFLFTTSFDDWSYQDFTDNIYNGDYGLVDPESDFNRPAKDAVYVNNLLGNELKELRILDYGGGSAVFAQEMKNKGYRNVETYDPHFGKKQSIANRKFDIITVYEVFEHTVRPLDIMADITDHLEPDGIVLFSTLPQPPDIKALRLAWWYAAPRNGHLSLFSFPSLILAWRRFGLRVAQEQTNRHKFFAVRRIPSFALNWGRHFHFIEDPGP